jgi:hypothetical protein
MLAPSRFLRRLNALRLLLAAALLCSAWSAQANTYKVGVGSQCSFGTVAEAVDAALHRVGSSTIYIATNLTYANQAISISPIAGLTNSIALVGGVPDCNNLTPAGTTTLNGGAGASVITIRGTMSVTLSHLTITGGHGSSGGGIDYAGIGNLNIDNSSISNNSAGNGGGIRFQGKSGAATMFLNTNTVIIGNTATGSGGGIRLEGQSTMTMEAAGTWVALNQAPNGNGGGIDTVDGSVAYIGSPGYTGGAAAIYANEAKYGGGISAGGFRVYLYTTDPLHPVALDNNTAFNTGGGLYTYSNPYGPIVCMQNFRITNNIAQEGTGVYDETGAIVANKDPFNGYAVYCVQNPPANSVACDPSIACTVVHDNYAMNVQNGNAPTDGSAILMQSGDYFVGANLDVRGNHGGRALRLVGTDVDFTGVRLSNCVFADNVLSQELILTSDGYTHLELDNCTLAHDSIGASRVIAANDTLALTDSIIDEGSQIDALAFSGNASNLTVQYNVAGDTTGFPAGLTNMQGRPTFVDVAHGDYRLFYGIQGGQLVKSLGIDYAPPVTGDDRDIRGLPRDQAIYSPMYGDRDLGAYEMQGVGDRIFIDTFGDNALLVH